jgi:hypothetical protein
MRTTKFAVRIGNYMTVASFSQPQKKLSRVGGHPVLPGVRTVTKGSLDRGSGQCKSSGDT